MTVSAPVDLQALLELAGFNPQEYRKAASQMILFGEPENDNEVYCLRIRGFAVREGCLLVFVDADQCISPAPDQRIMYLAMTPLGHWRVFQVRHRDHKLSGGGVPAEVRIV